MDALDFPIISGHPYSDEALRFGFSRFSALAASVHALPYGRPKDTADPFAIIREQTGTCSSKHRLLAAVAHACDHTEIELVVGIYAMSEKNTPGIAGVLERNGLLSIPEAHCYLRIGSRRHDFTGLASAGESPFAMLLAEEVISPAELHDQKNRLHNDALRRWSAEHSLPLAHAWAVREACISVLAARESSTSAH
jgi:hypothetical protein